MAWTRMKHSFLPAAVIVLALVIVYSPSFFAGFIWDDDDYVTNNWTLRSIEGLGRMWLQPGSVPQYYPLVHTTFWIEYHLWGLAPAGYHVVNVLLHALTTVLLWRVLRRLSIPGAWLAALLFAVHPVQVESVAWITERKNVLSGALYLAAMLSYLHFASPDRAGGRRWRFYVLALMLFAAALLSKTVTATLPAAVAVVLWWKNGRLRLRDVAPLLPMLLLGVLAAAHTAWLERTHVGATGATWDLSLAERTLIAGRAIWFYVGKLLWPVHLTFIYPRWDIDARDLGQWAYPAAVVIVLAGLWMLRRRLGRGPLASALLFVGTLVPALGFVNIYPMLYTFVADHYQYLASIALVVLATATVLRRLGRPLISGRLTSGSALMIIIIAVLGVLSWRQARMYRDLETLWRVTLQRNPEAWMAHNNLGILLAAGGRTAEAVSHLQTALLLHPEDEVASFNLGRIYDGQGAAAEAAKYYRQALAFKPDYVDARCNLGLLLAESGQLDAAIAEYRAALKIEPRHARTLNNLGLALVASGHRPEGIAAYREAIRYRPDYAAARNNLAAALAADGDLAGAVAQLEAILRFQPDNPVVHHNLAQLLDDLGRPQQAREHRRAAQPPGPDFSPRNPGSRGER